MKLFSCQSCGNIVYFDNRSCERCGHRLAYMPEAGTLTALEPAGGIEWTALGDRPGRSRILCVNAQQDGCNWLVPPGTGDAFCRACRHNGTIPDLTQGENLERWRLMELAKHQLFYALLRFDLPLATRMEDPEHGLIFNFLADPPAQDGDKVMTGHENGVITIALVEADDAEREKRRSGMGEPYRTLIGHFRHEVGHHYWDLLVRDAGKLDACRAVFGDDSEDYEAALKRHYDEGVPPDWQERFVSSYATTHPWEDFAETWAHYLHIVDTLEMASAFGMEVKPSLDTEGSLSARIDFDPYAAESIEQIIAAWLPFVFAMNSTSRAMGQGDLYPFVLAPAVIAKLGFIHRLLHRQV
ncbi:zinc-binding metallopeptidase family protein [Methylobacterium sp. sgz302541]|uniref:zinc-binding metallopeptidase family protein n=1 Tax=unclassified Methylobacterium TaxID=2615210 RepID=UPI003D33B8A5